MATGFGNWENTVKIEKVIRQIASSEIAKQRPATRLAEVTDINLTDRSILARFVGESNEVRIPFTSVIPANNGQWVRIGGTQNDRYVESVLGMTDDQFRLGSAEDALNTIMTTVAGDEWASDDNETLLDKVVEFFGGLGAGAEIIQPLLDILSGINGGSLGDVQDKFGWILNGLAGLFNILGGFNGAGLSDVAGQFSWLTDGLAGLFNIFGGFDGAELGDIGSRFEWLVSMATGLIDPSRIPLIPIGSIGQAAPNLLLNGSFDTEISMEAVGGWTWDGTTGQGANGSAKYVGNGTRGVLTSNAVLVSEGDKLNLEGYAKWSGVTSSAGPSIKLIIRTFHAGEFVSEVAVAQEANISGTGGGKGGGQYTVPTGVDMVRVQLSVEATVTAGTVWWDDISLTKPTSVLPMEWIDQLPEGIQSLWENLDALVSFALQGLGVDPLGGIWDKILDLGDELENLLGSTEDNAAGIANLFSGLSDVQDDVVDLQDRAQVLEGVIGYACRYMSTSPGVTTTQTTMPFDTQVGPATGVTLQSGGRFRLDSKGLWRFEAQTFFETAKLAPPRCFMDIVIRAPGGTEYKRLKAMQSTDNGITVTNVMPVTIPTAGYTAEVQAWTSALPLLGSSWRSIGGGLGTTQFSVYKISSETS